MIRPSYLIMALDALLMIAGFVLSLRLRLGDDLSYAEASLLPSCLFLIPLTLGVFRCFNIPQRVWEYTSVQDLTALVKAVTLTLFLLLLAFFLYNRLEGVPRSVFIIDWFVSLLLLSAPRILYRMWRNRKLSIRLSSLPGQRKIPVLVIGVNEYSELFLRNTVGNPHSQYRVVGLIDANRNARGRFVRGVKIYGALENVEKTVAKLIKRNQGPAKLVIAPDLLSAQDIKALLKIADAHNLTLARLPRVSDLDNASPEQMTLRPIALEDLLGRPQRALERDVMQRLIAGKTVLVTGAGGTIGAELCRQIAGYQPEKLVLLELSEFNLYEIERELSALPSPPPLKACIADIRDEAYVDRIFSAEKPGIVFHAAALKHVPLSEQNPCEAARTNTLGTRIIADACVAHKVADMVMISTDKAVNPTSVMGATKRLAESYLQALGGEKHATRFVTIRFGNVLGSTGSVIPLFRKQLEKGGPLTVTHRDMRRYFMTVKEAVELVLYAAGLVCNGSLDSGKVFVLDMGEPVYIRDLAEQLIRLSGLQPYKDIDIVYTGLRPGEKLFEELFHGKEAPLKTRFEGILLAQARKTSKADMGKLLKELNKVCLRHDNGACVDLLKKAIPEYQAGDS